MYIPIRILISFINNIHHLFWGVILFNISCDLINNHKEPFLNDEQRALIQEFAIENGYPESVPVDNFVEYLYEDWPYEYEIRDFLLTFPVQDTVPRTLVLTDILTKIGKSLRVYHSDRGIIHPAYIDSIEIRTDSVIILPSLSLMNCNLTHLPPEIGKIRTEALNLSNNYKTLKYLPDELMQISGPPYYFDTLIVKYDMGAVRGMSSESVSDSLKNWLLKHAAEL
jgi:hypothetical protein